MTLNASGPLSFGGATTGQSINLELGVSATALASINSTSFRTLANVPSGQISVSNFYSKSNSFGWISYVDGTGNLRATQAAFFADASGNTYFSYKGGTSADYSALARLDVNGATATYTRPWADGFNSVVVPATATLYTAGAGNFWACSRISDLSNYPYAILNSSLGYQSGKFVQGANSYPTNVAITPDGRAYVLGRYIGKQQEARIFCLGSNGSALGGWQSTQSSSYNSAIAPRTDNAAYWIYKTGQTINWSTLPAGGGNNFDNRQSTVAWSDGGYAIEYAGTDSSNNLYAITNQGRIFKITPAHSISGCFVNTSEQQSRISVYGSFIYVMTTNSSYNACNLYCYDQSLTPQWKNTFTFSNNNCATNGLNANATGIYAFFNNNVHGQFIMKIPLTGVPASGTKALTGPSGLSFTYTKTTFSVTGLAFGTPISNSFLSNAGYSRSASSAYPPGGTTAPNNQNTLL